MEKAIALFRYTDFGRCYMQGCRRVFGPYLGILPNFEICLVLMAFTHNTLLGITVGSCGPVCQLLLGIAGFNSIR